MFICYAAIANQYNLYRRQHVLNIRVCPPGSQGILGDFPEERRNQNLSKARTQFHGYRNWISITIFATNCAPNCRKVT